MNPVPQTNPNDRGPAGMSFGMPGVPSPHLQAQTLNIAPGPQKRLGLMAMAIDSSHKLTIAGKPHNVQCKDRRLYREAKGACFCMGPGCYIPSGPKAGPVAWYATEQELHAAHDPQDQLVGRTEIHVYGFWSNDDCAGPVDGCKACEKATQAARKGEGASPDAVKACAEHARVVGLLTPNDPAVIP